MDRSMDVVKSTRHSKITGDFAEHLILYWFSKYGFECASVDHTGIDLIARNPHTGEFMGISVKSRSRSTGKEGQFVSIPKDNFQKAKEACQAFGCIPYFAIVVDQGSRIESFIVSQAYLLKLFRPGKTTVSWKMSEEWLDRYRADPEIKKFSLEHKTETWWRTSPNQD